MIVEPGGDMWAHHKDGRYAVIPTNLAVKANGEAIMGAGVALQAARRWPHLPVRYGASINAGHTRLACHDERLLLAPTKHHWKQDANLELVIETINAIATWAADSGAPLVTPALGCGLGGLAWDDIRSHMQEAFTTLDVIAIPPR